MWKVNKYLFIIVIKSSCISDLSYKVFNKGQVHVLDAFWTFFQWMILHFEVFNAFLDA